MTWAIRWQARRAAWVFARMRLIRFWNGWHSGPAARFAVAGAASALDRMLSEYWSEKDGNVSVCTLVKAPDRQSFLRLREAVLKETPGALLLNKAALTDEIARVSKSVLPVFGVLVAVLNALLLFLLLGRQWRTGGHSKSIREEERRS